MGIQPNYALDKWNGAAHPAPGQRSCIVRVSRMRRISVVARAAIGSSGIGAGAGTRVRGPCRHGNARRRRSMVLGCAILAVAVTAANAELSSDVPPWRTITVGTTTSVFALLDALDAAGCGVGDLAGQALARPAFALSPTRMDVTLVSLSAAELGFRAETVRLADFYARARKLGFALVAAEVGPQLRLQYLDQPIGEFLHVGMTPITTWSGEPVILVVANAGAGLLLLGQRGHDDVEIPVRNRFVFAQSQEVATDME
jgi:hypothetical protein